LAVVFFATLLFATVNSRFTDKLGPIFSFSLAKPARWALLLIPVWATTSMASEYYAYQGRMYFDARRLELALTLNPHNDRALYDLSQVRLRRERDVSGSLQAITTFLTINPYHISGLFIKAEPTPSKPPPFRTAIFSLS
jgi:hypothetical protein